MSVRLSGSCACGRIAYSTNSAPLNTCVCHCRCCQKFGGGPFLPFIDFRASSIDWTRYPDIWSSSDIAERFFCKTCGTALGMRYFCDADRVGITMGTVEQSEPPLPTPKGHIFLAEKAPWFQLPEDGSNRYDGFNADFLSRIEKWKKENETASK